MLLIKPSSIENEKNVPCCGVVVITVSQLYSEKPELKFFSASNSARGVSEI